MKRARSNPFVGEPQSNTKKAVDWYTRGSEAYKANQFEEALACFNKDGQSINCLRGKSLALEKLGHLEEAIRVAQAWQRLEPTNPKPYLRVGKVMKDAAKWDALVTHYEVALNRVAKTDSLYRTIRERWREAKQTLKSKIVFVPPSKDAVALYEATQQAGKVDPLAVLPYELLYMIFAESTIAERIQWMRVSKRWRAYLSDDRRLWTDLSLSPFPRLRRTELARLGELLQHPWLMRSLKVDMQAIQQPVWLEPFLQDAKTEMRPCQLRTLSVGGKWQSGPLTFDAFLRGLNLAHAPLESVFIEWSTFSPAAFRLLGRAEALRFITFRTAGQCRPSDRVTSMAMVGALAQHSWSQLTDLDVSGNAWLTDDMVLAILSRTPHLESLNCSFCGSLTMETLFAVHRLTHVKNLYLQGLSIREAGIMRYETLMLLYATFLTKLEVLDLTGWHYLTSAALRIFLSHTRAPLKQLYLAKMPYAAGGSWPSHPELTVLDVSASTSWQADNLLALIVTSPQLRTLRLANLPCINDAFCEGLVSAHLTHLEMLDLSQCSAITGRGVVALIQHYPHLDILAMNNCIHIRQETIEWARSRMGHRFLYKQTL